MSLIAAILNLIIYPLSATVPLGLYHGSSSEGFRPILSIVVKEQGVVDFRVDRFGSSPVLEAFNVRYTIAADNKIQFNAAELVEPVARTNERLGLLSYLGYQTAANQIQAIYYPDDLAVRVIVFNAAGTSKILNIKAVFYEDQPVPDLTAVTPSEIEARLNA